MQTGVIKEGFEGGQPKNWERPLSQEQQHRQKPRDRNRRQTLRGRKERSFSKKASERKVSQPWQVTREDWAPKSDQRVRLNGAASWEPLKVVGQQKDMMKLVIQED